MMTSTLWKLNMLKIVPNIWVLTELELALHSFNVHVYTWKFQFFYTVQNIGGRGWFCLGWFVRLHRLQLILRLKTWYSFIILCNKEKKWDFCFWMGRLSRAGNFHKTKLMVSYDRLLVFIVRSFWSLKKIG